jgi:histidinol phosphatase-like enzyme
MTAHPPRPAVFLDRDGTLICDLVEQDLIFE